MTKKLQLYFNFTEDQEMFLMICFTHTGPFIQESQTAFQIINYSLYLSMRQLLSLMLLMGKQRHKDVKAQTVFQILIN